MYSRKPGLEGRSEPDKSVKHRVRVTKNTHVAGRPVCGHNKLLTPSTESLELGCEVLDLALRDVERWQKAKRSGVVRCVLQLGNLGRSTWSWFCAREFSHAFIQVFVRLAVAENMGKGLNFIHAPSDLMLVEGLEVAGDESRAPNDGSVDHVQ